MGICTRAPARMNKRTNRRDPHLEIHGRTAAEMDCTGRRLRPQRRRQPPVTPPTQDALRTSLSCLKKTFRRCSSPSFIPHLGSAPTSWSAFMAFTTSLPSSYFCARPGPNSACSLRPSAHFINPDVPYLCLVAHRHHRHIGVAVRPKAWLAHQNRSYDGWLFHPLSRVLQPSHVPTLG